MFRDLQIIEILREVGNILVFDFSEICESQKTVAITKQTVLKILAMFYDSTEL